MMFIRSNKINLHNLINLIIYYRKLKPSKPKISNELLEKFKEPKEFEEVNFDGNNNKHFHNWSFVNTDN